MGNMRYCRFYNTVNDFEECLNEISENGISELSQNERLKAKQLYELAKQYIIEYENI